MISKSFRNFNFNEFFTSPWVLWAISIVTAVLMWVYVTGMEESEYLTRKFSCPLEYRNLDSQAILRGKISEIDVEVRGPEQAIMRLDYNSIVAYVDARNLTPGKKYTQNVEVANLPLDVNLISVFPSQIVIDLVRQVARLMNVETVLPQNIPEGQYIEGVEIIPKEVGIRGAEDDVAKVGSVRITPSIEELQTGHELLIPVKFSQSEAFNGSVVIEPSQVRFKGTLARGLPKKRIPVNVPLTGTLDDDHEIKSTIIEPSEIQIEGESEKLALIDVIDTETVDISMFNEDQVIVVPLKTPDIDGVTIANSSGTSVKLSVQIGEVRAEKKLASIPIEIMGLPENSKNESGKLLVDPPFVSVTIEGMPSRIENFSPEESGLRVYVDMSNIFMTPVTLPVRTELQSDDNNFRIVRVEPQNITVNSAMP